MLRMPALHFRTWHRNWKLQLCWAWFTVRKNELKILNFFSTKVVEKMKFREHHNTITGKVGLIRTSFWPATDMKKKSSLMAHPSLILFFLLFFYNISDTLPSTTPSAGITTILKDRKRTCTTNTPRAWFTSSSTTFAAPTPMNAFRPLLTYPVF